MVDTKMQIACRQEKCFCRHQWKNGQCMSTWYFVSTWLNKILCRRNSEKWYVDLIYLSSMLTLLFGGRGEDIWSTQNDRQDKCNILIDKINIITINKMSMILLCFKKSLHKVANSLYKKLKNTFKGCTSTINRVNRFAI